MDAKLPTGHCRITLSFEGAVDDASARLIAFLKELPAEEAAQVLRGLQRSVRERRKKTLRVVRGGTP